MFNNNRLRGVLYRNLSSIWKAAKLSNDVNIQRNIMQAITNICTEYKMPNPVDFDDTNNIK